MKNHCDGTAETGWNNGSNTLGYTSNAEYTGQTSTMDNFEVALTTVSSAANGFEMAGCSTDAVNHANRDNIVYASESELTGSFDSAVHHRTGLASGNNDSFDNIGHTNSFGYTSSFDKAVYNTDTIPTINGLGIRRLSFDEFKSSEHVHGYNTTGYCYSIGNNHDTGSIYLNLDPALRSDGTSSDEHDDSNSREYRKSESPAGTVFGAYNIAEIRFVNLGEIACPYGRDFCEDRGKRSVLYNEDPSMLTAV